MFFFRVFMVSFLATFLIGAMAVALPVAAEDLPWNGPQGDRSYIPDGGDAPRNIAPDAPAARYAPPPPRRYEAPREQHREQPLTEREYSSNEISQAGHQFFGSVSVGLAKVIEHSFKSKGRPNGYILGEEAGGAFIAGLRYGEGTLYTKDSGTHKVYWQGPSLGYDVGAAGSKTMILVYNLNSPYDVYRTFGGVTGSAYLVGGVGVTFLQRDHVNLAPIVSGVGVRFGANVGYLKFTRRPTWNPF